MKTASFLAFLFAIAAGLMTYLYVTLREEMLTAQPQERWLTNTVEIVRTNTVVQAETNFVDRWQTNTAIHYVTNLVVREVPAKLPDTVLEAAMLGYKYEHAPTITVVSDALYKASPVTVRIKTNMGASGPLTEEAILDLKLRSEQGLRSKGVSTVENSPYELWLHINSLWDSDVPAAHYCSVILELKQEVLLTRQADAVKCAGSVWRSTTLAIVPKVAAAEELVKHVQTQLEQYCAEVERARASESRIESALPKVPASFFPARQ